MSKQDKNEQEIRETVRTGYRAIAIGQASPCCCSDRSGPADPARLAAAIGYDEEDLANLPDGANMGLVLRKSGCHRCLARRPDRAGSRQRRRIRRLSGG